MLGKLKKILLIALIITSAMIILTIANKCIKYYNRYISKAKSDIIYFELPEIAGTLQVANILKDADLIDDPYIFAVYAKHKNMTFKSGLHRIVWGSTYDEILTEINNRAIVKITINEGLEVKQILDLLESKQLGDRQKFIDIIQNEKFEYDFIDEIKGDRIYRLEGYLFPSTYEVLNNYNERDIIDMFLRKFDSVFDDKLREEIKSQSKTIDEIVTMASIIEKEAGPDSEKPTIASIFYNRLNNKNYLKLESCATIHYILPQRKAIISTSDTKIESPYNTYKYKGLPVGPISCPGEASINASIYPEKTDYYFFSAWGDNTNTYSKTYEEHLKASKLYEEKLSQSSGGK